MPDPFDFTSDQDRRVELPTASGTAEYDQSLAEAIDVIRHARAFCLVATDADGHQIHMSIGNGISKQEMLLLYSETIEMGQRNQSQLALEILSRALGLEDEEAE